MIFCRMRHISRKRLVVRHMKVNADLNQSEPPSRGAFLCVPGMFSSSGGKSPVQPDGCEGLAKRKGVVVRWGLKEA